MKTKNKNICFGCLNFYITWDDHFPYGCRAMGFKSKRMPHAVVKETSGVACMHYEPKKRRRRI